MLKFYWNLPFPFTQGIHLWYNVLCKLTKGASLLEEKEMGQNPQHRIYTAVDADCGADCLQ